MKEINERVTLRLEKDNLDRMDSFLQKSKEFSNRSQFLRVAVEAFIDHTEKTQEEISVKIPAKYLGYIDAMIRDGYFLSREYAVLRCIEEFLSPENVMRLGKHNETMGVASGKEVSVDFGEKRELLER
ncbi:MAG: ribbon-helix-helix domain-containing protein [Candidatus Thermoplasmatota archaeon]|nr:ribbon-helix-helix domain-containing protein [Candidatus Thermoplasmatota archaeon]